MKKQLFLLILIFAAINFASAQVVADFEDGTTGPLTLHVQGCGDYDNADIHPVDETFMVVDNPDASGINTSSKVLKFIRRGTDNGGLPWGGFWANVDPNIDVTTNKYAHIMVWKPMLSPVKFKLEGDPTLETYSMYAQSVAGQWVDMVIDFSTLTGNYAVMSLMPDFQDPFATAGDVDIFIDNIQFTDSPTPIGGGPNAVTFSVNMSYQVEMGNFDPATDFVDVAGNVNNWGDPNGNRLTAGEGNVYSVTLGGFAADSALQFKFRINGDWATSEFPDGGPNREYTVVDGTNEIMVWYDDAQPETYSVTFNVDMSYQVTLGNFVPATDFLDVAGNFNNWADPSADVLTEGDAYIYTVTLDGFDADSMLQFKFRINGDWNTSEFPNGGPNREYTVVAGENILNVWYNDEMPPPAGLMADFEDDTWGTLTPHVMGSGEYDNDALHAVDETFMIIDNPDPSGINTSSKVLKFIRRGIDEVADAQAFAGFWAQCAPPVNTTETKYVHYMVWKPVVSPLKFKLQGATQSEIFSTNEQTVTNGWQDMVFNFSEMADADYGVVALMPDFVDPFDRAETIDIFIDNILISSDPDPYTGIWNNKADSKISVYPNPFVSSVNVVLSSDMKSIVISNLVGQKLYEMNNVPQGTINIDASILDSGVYIITLTDNNNRTTSSKLMKN